VTQPKHPRRGAQELPGEERPVDMGKLNDLLGFHIRRVQLWSFQNFTRLLAPFDLRPADYAVLCMIEANHGLSQTALSNALGIAPAHIVRLLHRLEDRLLLRRATSSLDRRQHSLELTGHGRTILAKSHVLVNQHDRLLTSRLGSDHYAEIKRVFQRFGTDKTSASSSSED
jgi:DNA-binding MarR family transcriptional regulator